jgi:hypothetical protein
MGLTTLAACSSGDWTPPPAAPAPAPKVDVERVLDLMEDRGVYLYEHKYADGTRVLLDRRPGGAVAPMVAAPWGTGVQPGAAQDGKWTVTMGEDAKGPAVPDINLDEKQSSQAEVQRESSPSSSAEEPCLTCKGKGFNFDLISRRCEEDGCRETLVSKVQTMGPEKGTKVIYLCILHAGLLTAFAENANEGWNIVADSIDRVGRTATANRFGDSAVEMVMKHRSPSGRIPRSPYSCEPIVDEENKRDCPDCSTTD